MRVESFELRNMNLAIDKTGAWARLVLDDETDLRVEAHLPVAHVPDLLQGLMGAFHVAVGARVLGTHSALQDDRSESAPVVPTLLVDTFLAARMDGGGFLVDLRLLNGEVLRLGIHPEMAEALRDALTPADPPAS